MKIDIDLVFIVDETGSMGSWIQSTKENIKSIVNQVVKKKECKSLHVGVIGYRDHPPQDHSFVTRVFELTDAKKNMSEIQSFISLMCASGGGDCPESLDPAIHDLVRMNWREGSSKTAVVITDAPPHGIGSGGDGFPNGDPSGSDWMVQVESLKEMGVTLHTVTCGSAGLTVECLKKMAEMGRGVCVELSDAKVLPSIIMGATMDSLDKREVSKAIQKVIEEREKQLFGLDEPERVQMILGVMSKSGVVRKTLHGSKITKREIIKDDIIEGVATLRRLNPAGELCTLISKLFPFTGLSKFPVRAGLYDKSLDKLIPLKDIDISAKVLHNYAEVQIKQVFVNESDNPIEALYKFPVSTASTVYFFSCEIDGEVLIGKCMEKEKARERYTDALAEGKSAFLLEEVTPDLFSISVGNLLPKKQVSIKICFFYELESLDKDTRKLLIPTTFAPKFSQEVAPGKEESNRIDYKCMISFDIIGEFLKVESPSHEIIVRDRKVAIKDMSRGLDGDFSLLVVRDVKESVVVVESKDEIGFGLMIDFLPQFDSQSLQKIEEEREIIVLVDCSSSVAYQKEQLKVALKEIHTIFSYLNPTKNFVNVVLFASFQQCLFEGSSSSITKESLETIADWSKKLVVKGGSEINETLEKIKLMRRKTEGMRSILLITDGNAPNSPRMSKKVKDAGFNCYPIGIGVCPNRSVLSKVAFENKGFVEYCGPFQDIRRCIQRQFARIYQPLTKVSVEPKEIDLGPAPVISNSRRSVFVILQSLPNEIVIKGKNNQGKEFEFRLKVENNESKMRMGKTIHTIASKYLIRKETRKSEVVKMAKMYNVASKFTSFLALKENEERIESDMKSIEVPHPNQKQQNQQQQQPHRSFPKRSVPDPDAEPEPFVPPPKIKRSMHYVGGRAMTVDWGEKGDKDKAFERKSESVAEEEDCCEEAGYFKLSRCEEKKKSGFFSFDSSSVECDAADAIDGFMYDVKEKRREKKEKEQKKKLGLDKWHFQIKECLSEFVMVATNAKNSSTVILVMERVDSFKSSYLNKYSKKKGFFGAFFQRKFFVFHVFHVFECNNEQLQLVKELIEKKKEGNVGVEEITVVL